MQFKLCKKKRSVDLLYPILQAYPGKSGKIYYCLLFSIFVFIHISGFSQAPVSPLSFTQIPLTDPDINRPGGGAEQWIGQNTVNIPIEGTNTQRLDAYYRFNWLEFQAFNGAANAYTWTAFDAQINDAISKGQKFSFGIMTICGSCPNANIVGGFGLQYPLYLHNQMQAEIVKDWGSTVGGIWVPNWNSNSYLTALENLNAAINDHINTSSFNGVQYKNVIGYIDIRHYGNWGEWHHSFLINNWTDFPLGTAATSASLKRLIDAHVNKFPNFQLVILQNSFDANTLTGTVNNPIDVGYYALTRSNNVGKIGWRRDNWGWTDNYISFYAEASSAVYNGLRFDTSIMNRYKYAPVVGEPADLGNAYANGSNFGDLVRQVQFYHANSFGNGNLDNSINDMAAKNAFRAASKAAGYRLILEAGNITSAISSGSPFSISLNWKNIGAAPTYENWNVVYELRDANNTAIWSGTSTFNPRLFLPSAAATTITDNFTLPATVPQGNYNMVLIIRDPNGYRKPLPLAITGRNTDGSYLLQNLTLGVVLNQPPVANAGPNQAITLPASSVGLNGSGIDPDGTVVSYNWAKVSGPAGGTIQTPTTAATVISGLIAGIYLYRLTVTDNAGASASDTLTITVNNSQPPGNQPPVASAGADVSITLPTNSTTLNGSASSDPDGTIVTYAWTKLTGPAQFTIANAATASTGLSNLVQGVYTFRLQVLDNGGATASDTVTVNVNAAPVPGNQSPVANAGADINITLPTNTTTLNGTASNDPDGSIVTYTWSKISGPAQFTIGNTATSSTVLSNLVQGVYSFRLRVTDNGGATASDTVQVTVNPAAPPPPGNQPPVANAGLDITITLPTNVTTLDGTASNDPDGSIVTFAWSKISGPTQFAIANSAAASTTLSNLVQGVYSFRLQVLDNGGATASDTVTVTVNAAPPPPPPGNLAPIANAGIDISITLPDNSVMLNGTASNDPDGIISSYSWNKVSGPGAITIINSTTATPSIIGMVAGQYVFELTVTDNNGATGKDQVSVTVNTTLPIADAGVDTTIALPSNKVQLKGNKSKDPNGGGITKYSWRQLSGPTASVISSPAVEITDVSSLTEGIYVFELTVTNTAGMSSSASVQVTVTNNFRFTQYFKLYPNPVTSSSLLNLEYGDDKTGKIRILIFSAAGEKLVDEEYTKSTSTFTKQLNIGRFKAGMYYLQLVDSGGQKLIRPFVMQ